MNKVGILGYGVVGRSFVRFIERFYAFPDACYFLWHTAALRKEDILELEKKSITLVSDKSLQEFIHECSLILPSPGIALPDNCSTPVLTELDLFSRYQKKPIIAITGTVGKTTTAFFASELLSSDRQHYPAAGNIGSPMLDLCTSDEQGAERNIEKIILELSSYQLEHSLNPVCQIALITNCYPNHLDRHKSFDNYLGAKLKIIHHASPSDALILPYALYQHSLVQEKIAVRLQHKPDLRLILTHEEASVKQKIMSSDYRFIHAYYHANQVIIATQEKELLEVETDHLPQVTTPQNILQLIALLYAEGLDKTTIQERLARLQHLDLKAHHDHRQALCHRYNNIDVYNDSKATVPEATLAAVKSKIHTTKKIHLILGGFDKGIDRTPLVQELAHYNNQVVFYYFGHRKELFDNAGYDYSPTLEDVVQKVTQAAQPEEIILFSPSGSSHDFFSHYQERGRIFVELIKRYGVE